MAYPEIETVEQAYASPVAPLVPVGPSPSVPPVAPVAPVPTAQKEFAVALSPGIGTLLGVGVALVAIAMFLKRR